MNNQLNPISFTSPPAGGGGFLNPEAIVAFFGIREGMRIADFGCGSGHFTVIMAKLVGESGLVTAVDILDPVIEIIKAKAKTEGLKNLETVKSNLEIPGSSSLSMESQDIVLLKNILFQSNQKGEILKEAQRVLKSGGRLIVIDWKKGTSGFGPPDNLRNDSEELRKAILDVGFQFVDFIDAGAFHFGMTFRKK